MSDDTASTSSRALSSSSSDESARRRQRRRKRQPAVAKPITSIPDLRFEQSFLASVRGFIHEVSSEKKAREVKRERRAAEEVEEEKEGSGPATGEEVKEKMKASTRHGDEDEHVHTVMATRSPRSGEPELWLGNLRVEWWSIIYLTVRDQLLSPIVQGLMFTIGGVLLGNARTALRANSQLRGLRQSRQGASTR